MSYKALYREWRPQDFRTLVGQEHISQSLLYAVQKGRVAHAYLFAGPRGTGKTSTAKILAKAVNCLSPQDGEPCNSCQNCQSINSGRSMDVLEIDAASNRGIDEIRDIRERVNYVPSQGKYKVYIIDEVHMLTSEAFNALLKTLEEPPSHVVFILATTEGHKIPATILSRCQRYDFRRILPHQIMIRLQEILDSSDIKAEENVLAVIAKKAEGGLRDAISLLDQCISFGQDIISRQTVYDVLGMVRSEGLFSLTQAVIDKKPQEIISIINQLAVEGVEPGQVLKDVMDHLRNVLLLQVCGNQSEIILASVEEKELLSQQGKALGLNRLSQMMAYLAKIEGESRWRQNMRIVLEMALLNLVFQEEMMAGPNKTVKAESAHRENVPPVGLSKPLSIEREAPVNKGAAKIVQTDNQEQAQSCIDAQQPPTAVGGAVWEDVKTKWPQVMEGIKAVKKTSYAYLAACKPLEMQGDTLVLAFKSEYTFHKEKIEAPESRKLIEGILSKVLGHKVHVSCTLEKEDSDQGVQDSVEKALQLFGADVVTIKD